MRRFRLFFSPDPVWWILLITVAFWELLFVADWSANVAAISHGGFAAAAEGFLFGLPLMVVIAGAMGGIKRY